MYINYASTEDEKIKIHRKVEPEEFYLKCQYLCDLTSYGPQLKMNHIDYSELKAALKPLRKDRLKFISACAKIDEMIFSVLEERRKPTIGMVKIVVAKYM